MSAVDSSSRGGGHGLRGRTGAAAIAVALLAPALLALPRPAPTLRAREAGGALTVEEALELAFPGCDVERQTVYLTKEEQKRIRDLAGGHSPRAIVHPYLARREGRFAGTAYFDAHRVRTLPETLMIVVLPDQRVARVEVLAFGEPRDYLPRKAWYAQFRGQRLGPSLQIKRDIRGVTGATLTSRATTEAVRRVLAVHRLLVETGRVPAARAERGEGRGAPAAGGLEEPATESPSASEDPGPGAGDPGPSGGAAGRGEASR